MARNESADSGKIDNFFRSKYYSEDISKDKGKRANLRKSCEDFKVVDGYLTCIGKRMVITWQREKNFNTTVQLYFYRNPIFIYDV